jgi:hypothetical protein
MKAHLGWLVEKGHVVQYFNGLLALPEAHPKYRNIPAKKESAADSVKEEQVPVTTEASSEKVETIAEEENTELKPEDKKEEVSNEVADKLAE